MVSIGWQGCLSNTELLTWALILQAAAHMPHGYLLHRELSAVLALPRQLQQ